MQPADLRNSSTLCRTLVQTETVNVISRLAFVVAPDTGPVGYFALSF
jgi:hypothetical protein